MVTSKKTNSKKKENKSGCDYQNAYIRLRTVLDSLEITAIQYCLKDTNEQKRIKRADELVQMLLPIIQAIRGKTFGQGPQGCGEGYFDCGGVCVPYQCPISK